MDSESGFAVVVGTPGGPRPGTVAAWRNATPSP